MKSRFTLFLLLAFWTSCQGPEYFIQKGDYDKAVDLYSSKIRHQPKGRQNKGDLSSLEWAFIRAQTKDSTELALLGMSQSASNWPQINKIHRTIQARQQKVSGLGTLKTKDGYKPVFMMFKSIDSLETDSRRQAASFLYSYAQELLAITDSTGQRQPAREAYYVLKDLKKNYFNHWEQADALMDRAYQEGKTHVLIETMVEYGVSDGSYFWSGANLAESSSNSQWLVFYTDPTARPAFDFRAQCRLVSLFVSPESTSSTERIETKEVEDGYDEKLDTAGHVISRTPRYRTETTTITTYYASRYADGMVIVDLWDENRGNLVASQALQGAHSVDDSSELFILSAPTYWWMVSHVATDVEDEIQRYLRFVLEPI